MEYRCRRGSRIVICMNRKCLYVVDNVLDIREQSADANSAKSPVRDCPKCVFSPTSVHFKSEISDAFPRKRHQKRHLEFCIAYLRSRVSGVRISPGTPSPSRSI